MKIIDCFTFFNELDLLEFRLKLLDSHIDHFVLAESNITHSGQSKPFHFEENKERFKPWLHKITYIPVHQSAEGLVFNSESSYNPQSSAWKLENGQRDALAAAAQVTSNDDLVLLSDLDELPDPALLKKTKPFEWSCRSISTIPLLFSELPECREGKMVERHDRSNRSTLQSNITASIKG